MKKEIVEVINRMKNDDTITAYRISEESGVRKQTAYQWKSGKIELDNMTFHNVMMLYDVARLRYSRKEEGDNEVDISTEQG